MSNMRPIAVDLDGTLIHTDLLLESVCKLIKLNMFYLFMLPIWLLNGKANLKSKIASRVELNVDFLPYNEDLIDYLSAEHDKGRRICLATASNEKFAKQIVDKFDWLEGVVASNDQLNCHGSTKHELIKSYFNSADYVYAGNANIDLEVWQSCKHAVVVSSSTLLNKASKVSQVEQSFIKDTSILSRCKVWLKALRVHQWVKNALIVVPIMTAHQQFDANVLLLALFAFLSFSLCASSVYLLNDLLDLEDDRAHRSKKFRPMASGNLSILAAGVMTPVVFVLSLLIAVWIGTKFLLILSAYFLLTFAYSFYLKRKPILDVVILACLFTSRIVAGAFACQIALSFWLLAFSMFIFLSLAVVKRYTELLAKQQEAEASGKVAEKLLGRGYQFSDIGLLSSLGVSAGYLSVLVVALYLNSDQVMLLYAQPKLLWPICIVMLFWISRIWLIAHRGLMSDDPVVFAVKDKVSLICVCVIMFFGYLATNNILNLSL